MDIVEYGGKPIRFEEEEDGGGGLPLKRQVGFVDQINKALTGGEAAEIEKLGQARQQILQELAEERKIILTNENFSPKQKLELLDENRKTMVIAGGGTIRKTDSVVYGILIFGGVVLIALSLLTVFADLPTEVVLSFTGTVLGGTIATIAQKLGKI